MRYFSKSNAYIEYKSKRKKKRRVMRVAQTTASQPATDLDMF